MTLIPAIPTATTEVSRFAEYLAAALTSEGWGIEPLEITRVSDTSFSIPGDYRLKYANFRDLRFNDDTDVSAHVISATYADDVTVIVVSETLPETLVNVYVAPYMSSMTDLLNAAAASASEAEAAKNLAQTAADRLSEISDTELAIGLGEKIFSVADDKTFLIGAMVIASAVGTPSAYMHGQITDFSGGLLTVDVQDVGGSGTYATWNINISGTRGAAGLDGADGNDGAPGPQGIQGIPGPTGSGSGDVLGPASATAGHLAVFADGTGKTLSDGGTLPALSDATPAMNGTASAGVGASASRSDHVHASDTSKQAASSVLTTLAGTTPSLVGIALLEGATVADQRDSLGLAAGATADFGTTAGKICDGADARLSDARQCNNTFSNATTARSNLGLGVAATKAVGTTAGTVAAGDDARFSDSRKCDNTFDNAATARSNLGLGAAALLAPGVIANALVQLDASAKLPAVDGSQLTNLTPNIDLAMLNSFVFWRFASKTSGAIPAGYVWTLLTDELATKTNAVFDSTNKRYMDYLEPAYTNSGGTGDRTASITITHTLTNLTGAINNLTDGAISNTSTDAMYFTDAALAGKYIRFQFASAVLITEAKWYQTAATSLGTWKWQGSNNGTSWTDIGTTFTLGGVSGAQVQTQLAGNTTEYLYYQLLATAGSGASTPWCEEIEFKIGNTTKSATLKPTPITAAAAPSTAVLYLVHAPIEATTLNTDLKIRCSRDGGSTWSDYATLTLLCVYDTTYNLLKATCDLTTATSGTSILWEVTTLNAKKQGLAAVGMSLS